MHEETPQSTPPLSRTHNTFWIQHPGDVQVFLSNIESSIEIVNGIVLQITTNKSHTVQK